VADNTIEIIVKALDQASGTLEGVSGSVDKLSGGFDVLKGAAEGFIAAFALKEIIGEIEEAQYAQAQLAIAFADTGAAMGETLAGLDDYAAALSKTTTFSEPAIKSTEAVLLTFNKLQGIIPRVTQDAADMAARFGGDISTAAMQLGRALQDPERGIMTLRRAHIQLTETQIEAVKAFVAVGETAQAQDIILAAVEKRVHGSADAMANTLGGALTQLKNAFGALFDIKSDALNQGIKDLRDSISDPAFKTGVQDLVQLLVSGFNAVATAIKQAGETWTTVKGLFGGAGFSALNAYVPGGGGGGDDAGMQDKSSWGASGDTDLGSTKQPKRVGVDQDAATAAALKTQQEWQKSADAISAAMTAANDKWAEGAATTAAKVERSYDEAAKKIIDEFVRGGATSGDTSKALQQNSSNEVAALAAQDKLATTKQQLELDKEVAAMDAMAAKNIEQQIAAETLSTNALKLFNEQLKLEQQYMKDIQKDPANVEALTTAFIKDKAAIDANAEAVKNFNQSIGGMKAGAVQALGDMYDSATNLNKIGGELATTFVNGLTTAFMNMGQAGKNAFATLATSLIAFIEQAVIKFAILEASIAIMEAMGVSPATINLILGAGSVHTGGASGAANRAGGGYASGPTMVGENGPELLNLPSGSKVYNQAQLAFSSGGGGGNVHYAPQYNVAITADNAKQTQQQLIQYIEYRSGQDKADLYRNLSRNGIHITR
jgi:lambda family phage tail tape measure protein